MGNRRRMITLDDVRTLDTEVPVETSDVPEDTTHDDEERVRQLVRDMYATPGGRAILEWMFKTPAAKWELAAQRLEESPSSVTAEEDRERIQRQVGSFLREQFPHVTGAEWAEWGL